jgi:hypothetical protein
LYMNTNRFLSPKKRAVKPQKRLTPNGSELLGLAVAATFAFVWAIRFLAHSA